MKKISSILFCIISSLYIAVGTGCCDTELVAGLNRENANLCKEDPIGNCFNDVYVCKGENVYMCWKASSDVQNVTITDLGSVGLQGCTTIVAEVDKEYQIKATGGDCDRIQTVRINVVTEGEKVDIVASIKDKERLLWSVIYPRGQVSPNIMATSITPRCWVGCYPKTPIANYPFMSCGQLLCNGIWNGSKVNLNGGGLLTPVFINSATTFLPPDLPMAGEWTFWPQSGLDVNGAREGQAFFTLTVACKQ